MDVLGGFPSFFRTDPYPYATWRFRTPFAYFDEDEGDDDTWLFDDRPFRRPSASLFGNQLFEKAPGVRETPRDSILTSRNEEKKAFQDAASVRREIPIDPSPARDDNAHDEEEDVVGCRQCTFDNNAWNETCRMCGSSLERMDHQIGGSNADGASTPRSLGNADQSSNEHLAALERAKNIVAVMDKISKEKGNVEALEPHSPAANGWIREQDSESDHSDGDGLAEPSSSLTLPTTEANEHFQTDLELANRTEKEIARDGNCIFESFAHSVDSLPGRCGEIDAPSIRAVFCTALEELKADPDQQDLLPSEALKEISCESDR